MYVRNKLNSVGGQVMLELDDEDFMRLAFLIIEAYFSRRRVFFVFNVWGL